MANGVPKEFAEKKTVKLEDVRGEYVDLFHHMLELKSHREGKSIQDIFTDLVHREAVELYGPTEVRRSIGFYHTMIAKFEEAYPQSDELEIP